MMVGGRRMSQLEKAPFSPGRIHEVQQPERGQRSEVTAEHRGYQRVSQSNVLSAATLEQYSLCGETLTDSTAWCELT